MMLRVGAVLLLMLWAAAGAVARPTGTQGIEGNPNCPPPVINGITPRNWSCPTGTQRVTPPGRQADRSRPFTVDRCTPRSDAAWQRVATVHDMAVMVFDNYAPGRQPILIARISGLANPRSYLVVLSGTQVLLDRMQQTTGLGEDMMTSLNLRDAYSRSVIRALQAYRGGQGVPDYAHVYLVGHSLGGMVAQNLAASTDFNTRWNPRLVMTLGSPRTVDLPTSLVRRFAAVGDPIPTLSPAAWGLGGFNFRAQTWVDNGVPAGGQGDPIAPHMHYPDSQDLFRYDALGRYQDDVARYGTALKLDPVGQEYCPAQVL
jgi:hypothetical protein